MPTKKNKQQNIAQECKTNIIHILTIKILASFWSCCCFYKNYVCSHACLCTLTENLTNIEKHTEKNHLSCHQHKCHFGESRKTQNQK